MSYVLFILVIGEVKNQKAAMEEAQSIELEIQAAIEKSHKAVKSRAAQENHATLATSLLIFGRSP